MPQPQIIRQIRTIEDGTNTIDSPIIFTKQAKRIDNSISDLKRISSEIESLKQAPTSENKQKVKDLTYAYNSKILQAIKDLPKSKRVNGGESKQKSKNQVLWVDDHPSNNMAIMDVYRRLDVQFDLAVDTQQALDQLAKKSYDLIISDVGRHSEHDAGIKMIHEMKTKFADLPPIIIYSGDTAIQKHGRNALDVGASLATASARDLVLKMNEILKLQ